MNILLCVYLRPLHQLLKITLHDQHLQPSTTPESESTGPECVRQTDIMDPAHFSSSRGDVSALRFPTFSSETVVCPKGNI